MADMGQLQLLSGSPRRSRWAGAGRSRLPAHRVRLAAVVILVLSTGSCSGEAQPDNDRLIAGDTDLVAYVENLGYDPEAGSLPGILADNEISFVEYESVAKDLEQCLLSKGFPEAEAVFDDRPGVKGFGYQFRLPPGVSDERVDELAAECERSTQFGAVAAVWADLTGPTQEENELIDQLTDECLVSRGIAGGRDEARNDTALLDAFLECHDESTREVMGE